MNWACLNTILGLSSHILQPQPALTIASAKAPSPTAPSSWCHLQAPTTAPATAAERQWRLRHHVGSWRLLLSGLLCCR